MYFMGNSRDQRGHLWGVGEEGCFCCIWTEAGVMCKVSGVGCNPGAARILVLELYRS